MPTIKQEHVKARLVLQRAKQLALIRDFTKEDMLKALNSIDDNKASDDDGFDAYFYKKT